MFCVKDNEEILAGLLENFVLFLDEKSEEPSTVRDTEFCNTNVNSCKVVVI